MANVSEIREQLTRLLAGHVSRCEDFENWFVPYGWNIHKAGTLTPNDSRTQSSTNSRSLTKIAKLFAGD